MRQSKHTTREYRNGLGKAAYHLRDDAEQSERNRRKQLDDTINTLHEQLAEHVRDGLAVCLLVCRLHDVYVYMAGGHGNECLKSVFYHGRLRRFEDIQIFLAPRQRGYECEGDRRLAANEIPALPVCAKATPSTKMPWGCRVHSPRRYSMGFPIPLEHHYSNRYRLSKSARPLRCKGFIT